MLRAVRLAAKLGVAIDPKTAAPIPKLAPLMQNVPPARLFDEMQKLLLSGPRGRDAEEPARARPVARPAAAARRDPRAAARPALHRARARRHRPARARGPRRVARRSCSRRCCGTRCSRRGTPRKAQRRQADAGAVRRDGHACSTQQAQAHRDPAPVRGDDQGDLVAAAALRAARRRSGRSACSSTRASAPAGISWSCAARAASSKASSPASPTGGTRFAGRRRPTSARRC